MPEPRLDIINATPDQAIAMQRRFNADRIIEELPEMIEQLSKQNCVFIGNAGPWAHRIPCGSLGEKFIPPCEDGQKFGKPLEIDGLVIERYPKSEGRMDLLMGKHSEGWFVAHQIIGVGPMMSPQNSLVRYGVFVSKTWPPDKKTEADAREALNKHLNALVNEARAAKAQGQKEADETIRPDQHIRAAQMLGLDPATEPWMNSAVPVAKREKCEGCGTPYESGIILCSKCGFVINEEKFKKNAGRFPGRV